MLEVGGEGGQTVAATEDALGALIWLLYPCHSYEHPNVDLLQLQKFKSKNFIIVSVPNHGKT